MALSEAARRVVRPPYLLVTDQDGLRHLIRVSAIHWRRTGICAGTVRAWSWQVNLDWMIERLSAILKA